VQQAWLLAQELRRERRQVQEGRRMQRSATWMHSMVMCLLPQLLSCALDDCRT
jgi:hypothetical protein